MRTPLVGLPAARHPRGRLLPWVFGLPLALTLVSALLGPEDLGLTEYCVSFLMLFIPCWLLERWRQGPRDSVPLLLMITGMYWIYYSFPAFWGERTVLFWSFLAVPVELASIQEALLMAAVGVGCLVAGYLSRLDKLVPRSRTLDVGRQGGSYYLAGLMLVNLLAGFVPGVRYILGSGGRQIMLILVDTVGLVVFVIFFRRWLRGEGTLMERILLVLFLSQRLILNAASGVLGSIVQLLIVVGLAYLIERRRLPWIPVLLAMVIFLFLQAGKTDFRTLYWEGNEQGAALEKVEFWIASSAVVWGDAITDPTGERLRQLLGFIFARVSLLSQTANVITMTPAVVPHQGTRLYYYMAVTLVPRIIWPDKPSVSEANRFYQVAYGMSLEKDVENVSIAVGILAEAFIAFGWIGVVVVMFLAGVLLRLFYVFLLAPDVGLLLQSTGIVLLVPLLGIEGQFAQYFGGLAQQIFLILVVFLPVLHWQKRISRTPVRRTLIRHPGPVVQY